jgi:Mg-chelatase subunit ChlD
MPLPIKIPLSGLAARKAALNSSNFLVEAKPAPKTPESPEEATDRIGIVFDDSMSMASYDKIEDAREGVVEFLRSCNPETTAIAIYPLNQPKIALNVDLPSTALQVKEISPRGSTPILTTLKQLMDSNLNRVVLFSDGEPTDVQTQIPLSYVDPAIIRVCSEAKKREIIIDTVFISSPNNYNRQAEEFLKYIANVTGGIFLKFEAGKSSFRNSFKYLAPAYRALLADKSFVDKIQSGE